MCFNVLTRLGKLCCWMLIKNRFGLKDEIFFYFIFNFYWILKNGDRIFEDFVLWNESYVRMKIIVLLFKFSVDLLLLMFVWDEIGSVKKKNLFYMYSVIYLDY